MAFKANFIHPDNGYVFDKKDIIVRARSRGAEKLAVSHPDENPDEATAFVWTGIGLIGVFINNSQTPIWTKELTLRNYDTDSPAEKQFYEAAKQITSQLSGEEIPLFSDIENV